MTKVLPEIIRWRVHLRSSPEKVYGAIATPEGRATFWAESAETGHDVMEFRFSNGQRLMSKVLEATPRVRFRITYFGGSVVTFEIRPTADGGTDLTLLEEGSPPSDRVQNWAGWVSVLLSLKAALDFGVDIRNHDPERAWEAGFVDA